jgi:hypothetical protein
MEGGGRTSMKIVRSSWAILLFTLVFFTSPSSDLTVLSMCLKVPQASPLRPSHKVVHSRYTEAFPLLPFDHQVEMRRRMQEQRGVAKNRVLKN